MKIHFGALAIKACILMTMVACSTVMVLNKRLPNEWNISKYEEKTPDGTATSVVNIGSIRFESNGTGTKSVNFKMVDRVIEDYQPFEWKVIADTVLISGTSYFSKPWTVIGNTRSSQVWKSTDKLGNTQTMVLTKNKSEPSNVKNTSSIEK
jgi:hypothetical protein